MFLYRTAIGSAQRPKFTPIVYQNLILATPYLTLADRLLGVGLYLRNLLCYSKRVTRTGVGVALLTHHTLSAPSGNGQFGPCAIIQLVVYHLFRRTGMLSRHRELGNVYAGSARNNVFLPRLSEL